jgi:hypothetical protein
MDFKEYLRTQNKFNLSKLASLMWPNNKTASHYLSLKLNDLNGRSFTEDDEKLARQKLKELGHEIIADSKNK